MTSGLRQKDLVWCVVVVDREDSMDGRAERRDLFSWGEDTESMVEAALEERRRRRGNGAFWGTRYRGLGDSGVTTLLTSWSCAHLASNDMSFSFKAFNVFKEVPMSRTS